ncbi:MAG: GNAT family N-acetyltransferase [Thermoplasmata archaeon]|nr:MAG: GNAT family N-acetyltransferase [Thermoplasmata archaeon]
MEISKGDQKDIDSCLSIAKELKQYFTEEAILKMGEDLKSHVLYVALDSVAVVGFVTIYNKNKHVAEISWIGVKLDFQHQGIGSALIDHITFDLKSQGIKLLEVKTLAEDGKYKPYEITRRFYEKMGFVHLDTIDHYPGWGPENPCAIYIKVL